MSPADHDSDLVIAPPPRISLPVRGTEARFPVHRLYCVGRNYAEHAVEMGHDPAAEPPFFFLKSPDNLLSDGRDFPYPPMSGEVHHEVELVVALQRGGRDIATSDAPACIFGHAVGLDMTRRDLQADAKRRGRPWETAKAFEHSAPCGTLAPIGTTGPRTHGDIVLSVNGQLRQNGRLEMMIWKPLEIIAHLSRHFELRPGDLIMTGTPAGVGPVRRGDALSARIDGLDSLELRVI